MAWQIAAAALAASLIGNKIARDEHAKVAREKSDRATAGLIERTAKADRELKPLFTKAAEDISPGKEKELLNTEDIKNLATIKQTKSRMTPLLSKGLQIGGKKSGRFTKLQSDRMGAAQSRGDLADQAMARFMSRGRVGQIRGHAVTDGGLGRTRSGDEIHGDRLINDLVVAGIQPNSGTLAFADALRIAGMMASLYNMGSSFGAEAGAQAGAQAGTVSPSTTIALGEGGAQIVPMGVDAASAFPVGMQAIPESTSWLSSFGDWAGNLFTPSSSVLPTEVANTQSFIPFSRGVSNRFGAGPVMSGMRMPNNAWGNPSGTWWGGAG